MLDNGKTCDWGHRTTWLVQLGWTWATPLISHCSARAPHTWAHCQVFSTGTAADSTSPCMPINISELHIPVLTSAVHHCTPAPGGNCMRKGYDEAWFPTVIKTVLSHEVVWSQAAALWSAAHLTSTANTERLEFHCLFCICLPSMFEHSTDKSCKLVPQSCTSEFQKLHQDEWYHTDLKSPPSFVWLT